MTPWENNAIQCYCGMDDEPKCPVCLGLQFECSVCGGVYDKEDMHDDDMCNDCKE